MYVPSAVTKQSEIQDAIVSVERSLAPDVVRIRYDIAEDWSGQWAIFFRIVLTDDAAKHRLRDVRTKVVWGLSGRLDLPAWAFSRTTISEASRNRPCCRNRRGLSRRTAR